MPYADSTKEVHRSFIIFCAATALLYVIVVAIGVVGYFSIQNSRRESCQRTYQGQVEVFRPLFPKRLHMKEFEALTDSQKASQLRQVHNLHVFRNSIDMLAANCSKQTATIFPWQS